MRRIAHLRSTYNFLNADLGPELLQDNDFDAATNWTLGTGWSISGGKLIATAATSTVVQQPSHPLKVYRMVINVISITGGAFIARDTSLNTTGIIRQPGIFQVNIDSDAYFILDGLDSEPLTAEIEIVSLKEYLTPPPAQAPAFNGGAVGLADDETATIQFTLPLEIGSTDGTHVVQASGGAVTVDSELVDGNGILLLSLSRAIANDETLTYAYTTGGSNPLQSTSNVHVVSFTGQSIENLVESPLLGAELLVNTWDDSDPDWDEDAGVLTGTVAHDICGHNYTNPAATMRLVFEIFDYSVGSFQFRDSGTNDTTGQVSGDGVYSFDMDYIGSSLIADGSDGAPFTGKIRNVSLREVLIAPPDAGDYLNGDIGMESGLQIPNTWWAPSNNNSGTAIIQYRTDIPYQGTHYLYTYTKDIAGGGYNRGEVRCLDNLGWGPGRMNWYEEYWIGFMFRTIDWNTYMGTDNGNWCSLIQSHATRQNTTDHNSVNLFHMGGNTGTWGYSSVGYPNIDIHVWDIENDTMIYTDGNGDPQVAPNDPYWTSPEESFRIGTPKWHIPISGNDNTWHSIVMNLIHSPGPHATINPGVPTGKFKFWHNDSLEIDFVGPNVFYYTQEGNPAGEYGTLQTGMYKGGTSHNPMAGGYDNIKIMGSDGSYAQVDPS